MAEFGALVASSGSRGIRDQTEGLKITAPFVPQYALTDPPVVATHNKFFRALPPGRHENKVVTTADGAVSSVITTRGMPPNRDEIFAAWEDFTKAVDAFYDERHANAQRALGEGVPVAPQYAPTGVIMRELLNTDGEPSGVMVPIRRPDGTLFDDDQLQEAKAVLFNGVGDIDTLGNGKSIIVFADKAAVTRYIGEMADYVRGLEAGLSAEPRHAQEHSGLNVP